MQSALSQYLQLNISFEDTRVVAHWRHVYQLVQTDCNRMVRVSIFNERRQHNRLYLSECLVFSESFSNDSIAFCEYYISLLMNIDYVFSCDLPLDVPFEYLALALDPERRDEAPDKLVIFDHQECLQVFVALAVACWDVRYLPLHRAR